LPTADSRQPTADSRTPTAKQTMDIIDRKIINELQAGLPVCEAPYAEAAATLGLDESELIDRLRALLDAGYLSRFGPMYHAERLGGGLTLAALHVPEADFERVTHQVNAFPEVAHNYARDHYLNMWFVLATETPERIDEVLGAIERETGLKVYNMPKRDEFFVGLRFEV
jgi:DNA-binding Lrp family transcriptional regulator